MSGSVQSGDGSTVTQLDPDIKNAWLAVQQQAQDTSQGLLDSKLPKAKVAGQDADTQRADTVLNTSIANDAGFRQLSDAVDLAKGAGANSPQQIDPLMFGGADVGNLAKANNFRADAVNLGDANTYNPATLGKADTYNAALIDKSKVGTVDGGSLAQTNLKPYLNPYQQDVTDATIADWQHGLDLQKNSDKADAAAANAFGNSRYGVVKANTNDAADRTLASTLANLNSQNFGQAQAAAQSDLGRGLQADTTNQGTNLAIQTANQGSKNAAGQFNTGVQNQFSTLDQAAKNAAREYGATVQNQFDLQTGANKQQASQFNAGNANAASQFNAGQVNTGKLTQAQLDQQAGLANQGTDLTAQQANQQAGLTSNAQDLSAAQLLAGMGQQKQNMNMANVAALNAQGQINQGQAQAALDALFKNQTAKYQQPIQALEVAESPFKVIPQLGSGGTSNTQSSGKGLGI